MRSSLEITADRRLLTPRSTAKAAAVKCVFRATLRLRRDVMDLSATREFACAPAAFRWRSTRNKAAPFQPLASFRNNGHDERSQTVLAPSFPSRREVGDQCSDPAARCFGARTQVLNGVLILDRPLASGSSLKIGCRPSRSPLLFEASPRRAGGPLSEKRAFIEMSDLSRASVSLRSKFPQLCGELVNTGGAGPS